jgi:cell division protein FtsB
MSHENARQRTPGEGAPSQEPIWPLIVAIVLWFGAVAYCLRETAALARQLARQREALEREVREAANQ